jgi:alpha-D-ribose 1-methylphosphonate 5-phosphate C-P lyase
MALECEAEMYEYLLHLEQSRPSTRPGAKRTGLSSYPTGGNARDKRIDPVTSFTSPTTSDFHLLPFTLNKYSSTLLWIGKSYKLCEDFVDCGEKFPGFSEGCD